MFLFLVSGIHLFEISLHMLALWPPLLVVKQRKLLDIHREHIFYGMSRVAILVIYTSRGIRCFGKSNT